MIEKQQHYYPADIMNEFWKLFVRGAGSCCLGLATVSRAGRGDPSMGWIQLARTNKLGGRSLQVSTLSQH